MTTRPRALDLFCGAGGASMGLHQAGFEVVGVDIEPQPNYPFGFLCADVMNGEDMTWVEVCQPDFDLVWASPPCQRYMTGGNVKDRAERPDLIGQTRRLLKAMSKPWVIENVPGAPLREDIMLCGSHFGLPIRRHGIFEVSFPLDLLRTPCDHSKPIVGVYGHSHGERGAWPGMLPGTLENWQKAMGIDWMTAKEMSEAIPPAYAKYIGEHFLKGRSMFKEIP